jgi:hypothetical protein
VWRADKVYFYILGSYLGTESLGTETNLVRPEYIYPGLARLDSTEALFVEIERGKQS